MTNAELLEAEGTTPDFVIVDDEVAGLDRVMAAQIGDEVTHRDMRAAGMAGRPIVMTQGPGDVMLFIATFHKELLAVGIKPFEVKVAVIFDPMGEDEAVFADASPKPDTVEEVGDQRLTRIK